MLKKWEKSLAPYTEIVPTRRSLSLQNALKLAATSAWWRPP